MLVARIAYSFVPVLAGVSCTDSFVPGATFSKVFTTRSSVVFFTTTVVRFSVSVPPFMSFDGALNTMSTRFSAPTPCAVASVAQAGMCTEPIFVMRRLSMVT